MHLRGIEIRNIYRIYGILTNVKNIQNEVVSL